MTSRELLEHIRNAPSFMGGDARYEATTNSPEAWNEDIDRIEKDLEVLDIIKRNRIGVDEFVAGYDFEGKPVFVPYEGVNKRLIMGCVADEKYRITEEEYEKIKEWMENDK